MIQILRRDQPAPPSCFGQAGKVVPADAQSGQDHHFSRRDMPLTDPPADKAFLPAESCALCTVEGGQPVDGGSDRGDDGSPRSVALTAWQAPIPSQACVLSTGSQPRDQTMWTLSHGSANGDEARSPNMIMVGSVELPIPEGVEVLFQPEQDRSGHLLSQDQLPSVCSPIDSAAVGVSACTMSSKRDVDPVTPPHHYGNGLFAISLSGHSQSATRPTDTGDRPCTPCTGLDVLRSELAKAISPVLSRLPDKEPAITKRRPRAKRQPVSNPRRSVRIARGMGRGSTASKQQNVLIRKLCLANEGEQISDEALQAYVRLFDRPLEDAHIRAILALFGWDASVLPLATGDGVVEDRH